MVGRATAEMAVHRYDVLSCRASLQRFSVSFRQNGQQKPVESVYIPVWAHSSTLRLVVSYISSQLVASCDSGSTSWPLLHLDLTFSHVPEGLSARSPFSHVLFRLRWIRWG